MPLTTQGLDPLLQAGCGSFLGGRRVRTHQTTAQLNVPLIEQATEPEGRGLLQTGKVVLPMGEPGKFGGG